MSTFKREERYVVLKCKDIEHLSVADQESLAEICHRINIIRTERGKSEFACVVVEHDWPEYDLVWGLLKYRCSVQGEKE